MDAPIQYIEGRADIFQKAKLTLRTRVREARDKHGPLATVTLRILGFGGLAELPAYSDHVKLEADPKVQWMRTLQDLTSERSPGSPPPLILKAAYDLPADSRSWPNAKHILKGFASCSSARLRCIPAYAMDSLAPKKRPSVLSRVPALSCLVLGDDTAMLGLASRRALPRTESAILIQNVEVANLIANWFDEFPWETALPVYDPVSLPDIGGRLLQIEREYVDVLRTNPDK
jgi:hypothetical protein